MKKHHADIVIAEYRAQRCGRQLSSTNSFELTMKQAHHVNLESNTVTSDRTNNLENLSEVPVQISKNYPITKVRVNEL